MVELQGVSKSYGSSAALVRTDLAFEPGKTTALIGPSGCGKSTILRLIVGLTWPTTGSILVGGQPVTPENALDVRRRIGYVIQDGGLFPHLTAERNVTLMASHIGLTESEVGRRVAELCGLTRFPREGLDRYPTELSGGQRQRVGLMRALMLKPEVLLLDEPLGALDPMVRASLQDDLRAIFQDLGQTVVMVTHDLAEAAFFGDRVVLMREGRVVQQGAFKDMVESPSEPFVTEFVNAQRKLVLA